MKQWQCVEEDFDPEDETTNFKNRKIFNAENHIEEWLTLRTFETPSEVIEKPNVRTATSASGMICVSIDETVFVFKDAKCSDLIYSINVGSEVDCCCFIDKANVFLIATRKGDIHCISLQCYVVFARTISTEKCSEGSTFVNVFEYELYQNKGTFSALVVDHCGNIYRISWQDTPEVNSKKDVAIQVLYDGSMNGKVSSAILIPGKEITIALFGENLTLWSRTSENICDFSDFGLKQCVKAQMWKEKFFMCLTSDGELAMFCAQTLLCCTKWQNITIQDFIIVKDENDPHKENIALLLASDNLSKCINILSLPDLKIQHEVKIAEKAWFISSSHTMCIEGFTTTDNVEKLRIIVLSNCHPRQRLQLCLKEHKFDEAEALAQKFGLDVEIVFKEKALFFVKTLSVQINCHLFSELICTLDKISDVQFVASFCAEQYVCQIDDMKNLLQYSLKRIQGLKKPLPPDIEKIQFEICSKFRNLETISFLKEKISFNTVKWRNILDIDWLKACFTELSTGNIDMAELIWLRHLQDGEILKEEEIKQLFVSISSSTKWSRVLKWLKFIIPYIHQYASDIMEYLIKWVVERAKLMENGEEQWPSSAIIFVEEFYALTKNTPKLREDKPFRSYGHEKNHLLSFHSSLRDVESLINNYGIKIQLEEFLQENKLEVAKNILRKVTHHDVDRILNGFMKYFMEKHSLSIDSVVLHFIEKLLTAVGDHWIHLPVSNWEPIVVTCISYVQSVQDKIKCILAALKFATIPWSDAMKTLAAEGCELNHPQTIEIKRLEKLVQIKLLFKKYKLPANLLVSSKYSVSLFLIRKIVMEAQDEMLKDVLIIADDSTELKAEAYTMCLHYFISGKMCSEAQIILESMDLHILEICYKRLLCRIEVETDLNVLYCYIDVMNSVSYRLLSILSIRTDLQYIRSLYLLNLNFGYKAAFLNFSCVNKRCSMFQLWIKTLVNDGIERDFNISSLCKDAKYVAQLCFFPSGDGLLEVFKHLPREIFTREGNQIMETLKMERVLYSRDKLRSLSKEKFIKISGSDSDALPFCRMMTDIVLSQKLCINDPWLHLLPWINRARDLSRMSVCCKTEQINDFRLLSVFQDSPGSAWRPGVIRFLQLIFQSIEGNNISGDMTLELQRLTKEQLEEGGSIMLIALLNMSKCSLELISSPSQDVNNTCLQKIMENYLSTMVHSKNCDIIFAGGVLVSLEATTAEVWLRESVNEFRTRFQKLERIAKLGLLYSNQKNINLETHFKSLKSECLWARHLRRCNMFCEKTLIKGKREIVSKLIFEKDIGSAEEFCNTFGINFTAHLCECLEYVILSWNPDFEIKTNKKGQRTLLMKNNEDDILDTCLIISERMEKKDLKDCLQKITAKINYYYYEMYCCVSEVKKRILQEEPRPQFLLLFLRNYLRSSIIQKEEKDEWFLKYQNSHELPAIAEWRLPFWPKDMDKVIKSELTLNNYEQWLCMAATLNVSEDVIRVIVLKQLSNMPELSAHDSDWSLDSLDETIIDQIRNCAKGIINGELCCAVLYRLFRYTKRGIPKAQLAKLFQEFAVKWADAVKTNEAVKIMKNAMQAYFDISTANILYKYGLNKSCYLDKISKPEILVTELYDHPDIVNANQDIRCPNINSAVNEISKVHTEIKWKDLLLKLLEEWLAPANSASDKFDDTVTIQVNLQTVCDYGQKEVENFARASYLLNKQDSNDLVVTLLDMTFGNGKERNIKFKCNALTCIMSTLPMKDISNLCGKTPESIRQHLHILQFVSDLDSLGYIMTVPQFVNCKKYDLVMELISSGQKNRQVLSLAARIAVRFKILDSDIWEQLLKYMIQGCMYEDLEDVLGKVPLNTPGIVEAWTHVVFVPFHSCSKPLSDEQQRSCLNALKLLQKCQVAHKLDLVQMAEICFQFDFPHWAAMILPYMSREQLAVLKKKILKNYSVKEILCKLEDIEDYYMLSRIKTILEEMDDSKM